MQRLSRFLVLLSPFLLAPLVGAQPTPSSGVGYSPVSAVFTPKTGAEPLLEPSAWYAAAPVGADRSARDERAVQAWKRSLIPVVASQGLDVASSWGMRELNPMLAGSSGRFGGRAVAIKGGAVAGIVGLEYLIVKKWPGAARVLSKLNWSSSVLTSAFAVHNFAIK